MFVSLKKIMKTKKKCVYVLVCYLIMIIFKNNYNTKTTFRTLQI